MKMLGTVYLRQEMYEKTHYANIQCDTCLGAHRSMNSFSLFLQCERALSNTKRWKLKNDQFKNYFTQDI